MRSVRACGGWLGNFPDTFEGITVTMCRSLYLTRWSWHRGSFYLPRQRNAQRRDCGDKKVASKGGQIWGVIVCLIDGTLPGRWKELNRSRPTLTRDPETHMGEPVKCLYRSWPKPLHGGLYPDTGSFRSGGGVPGGLEACETAGRLTMQPSRRRLAGLLALPSPSVRDTIVAIQTGRFSVRQAGSRALGACSGGAVGVGSRGFDSNPEDVRRDACFDA